MSRWSGGGWSPVAAAATVLVVAILPSAAHAAPSEIKQGASDLASTSSASRITFTWQQAISTKRERVDYRVTIAGNRALKKDSNFQVKTFAGHTRTANRIARESATFKVRVPETFGFGPRIWVRVDTRVKGGQWRADTRSLAARFSAGLKPADPESASPLVVTPTCKGITARWGSAEGPARSRGMELRVASRRADGTYGAPDSYTGYEPANSVSIATLSRHVTYRVQARATSVRERSGWTAPVETEIGSCQPKVLRVGTYNTQIYRANKVSWTKYRAARVASQIKASNLDLVGVQETLAINGKMLHTLTEKLGGGWQVASGSLAGTHLLYKYGRLTAVGRARQYPDAGDTTAVAQGFDTAPKVDSDGSYHPKTTVVIVNLHIPKGLDQAERQKQVSSALTLADDVRKTNSAPRAPTVFLGDFYLATSEERRTAVRRVLSREMADTEFYSPGRALDLFNSRNNLEKCPPRTNGVKVDGIFVDDRVAVTSWKMPKYQFSKGCFRAGFPSDHNLITANLWFTSES